MSRPRLRPVTDAPPRAVLYLRQSISREESISLELQEQAGREYCAQRGYDVVAVEADAGISGRTWARPAVQRVMAMIDDGRAEVIVLWKWSRLSRSRRDWAVAADRAEVAGGRIESATEPIDVTTSAGRFARGVMTELAAFESERIGDVWREVHARRVASGRPANGKPRFGYVYDVEAKVHRPDPVTGPVLADLYARYVGGESVYSLVRWLNASGYETVPGYTPPGSNGAWSERSLRRVLDRGFGAGFFMVGDELRRGIHEPVIDEATWEAYQVSRQDRRVVRGGERSQYLLSGLVKCACGARMTAGLHGHARAAKMRCKKNSAGIHEGGYVMMHLLEAAVLDWLREVAAEVDDAATAASEDVAHAQRSADQARFLEREVAAAREELLRATRAHLSGVIPQDAYLVVRGELEEKVASLSARLLAAQVAGRRVPAPQVAASLLADWETLSVELRRGALRQLIAHVLVRPGRPRAEIRVVPIWEGER